MQGYVRTTWAPLAGDTGTDVAPGSWGCGIARATEISQKAERAKAAFILGNVDCVSSLEKNLTGNNGYRLTARLTERDPHVDGNTQRLEEFQTLSRDTKVECFLRSYYSFPLCHVQITILRFSCQVHETKQGVGLSHLLIGGSLLFFGCCPQPQNKQ
jgi:hypothetical protein